MTNSHFALPTTTNDPLVTIAIPTFNRSSWLKECIISALAQSYPRFEILVSDNASTDETAEVLKAFNDLRFRAIRQKANLGLARNWNACLAEAKGEYIVFVSDDDRIAPCLLDRCIALARKDPQIPIVIALSDQFLIAEARRLPASSGGGLGTGIWRGVDILREFLKGNIYPPQMCGIMLRTQALRETGGFPIDFYYVMDMACWVPLLLKGPAGLVNESCATFAVHDASQTARVAMNLRVDEIRKTTELISKAVDRSVIDQRERAEIKLLAKQWCRYFCLNELAKGRKKYKALAARFDSKVLPNP